MQRRTWGIVLIVVGIILALLSAVADVIRIGMLPETFGLGQILGLVVGIVLVGVGLYLLFTPAPAPAPATAPPAAPPPAAAAPPAPPQRDDLTRLEGIGPAIQDILYSAGLTTFAALAEATPERLAEVLRSAGFAAPFDASSWPEQATLAARGEWDALKALQDRLTGGRQN